MARLGQFPQMLIKLATGVFVLLACFFIVKAVMIWLNPQSSWIAPPAAATATAAGQGQSSNTPRLDYNFDPFHRDYVPDEALPQEFFDPDADVADTTLNLKLKGTTAPEQAIIEGADRKQKTYGAGDEISSGVTLESIHHTYVILQRDGNREKLTVERDETGLTKTGQTNISRPISKSGFNGNPAELLKRVSITPHKNENNRLIGYKIEPQPGFDIKPLGFRNGDIVTRIGSQDLTSPGIDLGSTVVSAISQGNPTAQIMRRGRKMTIRIRVPS